MSTEAQLLELLGFLSADQLNPNIQCIALQHLLPYSAATLSYQPLFSRPSTNKGQNWIQAICNLVKSPALPINGKHDAIKILINLSNSAIRAKNMADVPHFVTWLVETLQAEQSLLADPIAMLLSNLAQFPDIREQLLPYLPQMVHLFVNGADKALNKNADFDFLASVFANMASTPKGRTALAEAVKEEEPALAQVATFTEHPSVIRRGGVASTLKNAAFEASNHTKFLANDLNLLPRILLPLCGNEEFPIEEFDSFPPEIQMLPEDKTREADPAIRAIHLEALLLLCTSRACREAMRSQNVYRVIQMMHKAETDEHVKDLAVRLVGLLMRDEAPEEATIEEVQEPVADSDAAMTVEEV